MTNALRKKSKSFFPKWDCVVWFGTYVIRAPYFSFYFPGSLKRPSVLIWETAVRVACKLQLPPNAKNPNLIPPAVGHEMRWKRRENAGGTAASVFFLLVCVSVSTDISSRNFRRFFFFLKKKIGERRNRCMAGLIIASPLLPPPFRLREKKERGGERDRLRFITGH